MEGSMVDTNGWKGQDSGQMDLAGGELSNLSPPPSLSIQKYKINKCMPIFNKSYPSSIVEPEADGTKLFLRGRNRIRNLIWLPGKNVMRYWAEEPEQN